MWEAKYLKKSAIYCWKSTEIHQKLHFFFICPSLKPHKIQMIKDNSKFQKHGTWFINWLHFLFFNLSSKPHSCPLKEANLETVKVVNFATKWLNLYPHTVFQICLPKILCGGAILRYFSILRQRWRLIFMENVRMSIQLLFAFVISHLASPIFIFDMKVIIFVGHSKHRSLHPVHAAILWSPPFEMSNATTNPLSTFVN